MKGDERLEFAAPRAPFVTGESDRRRFDSGPDLTPQQMVEGVQALAAGWSFDRVSVGVPTPVRGETLVRPETLAHHVASSTLAGGRRTRHANGTRHGRRSPEARRAVVALHGRKRLENRASSGDARGWG